MKIYIAGKITGDPDYKAKFSSAAATLEAAGHTVLNPATLPGGMAAGDYMRVCFAMIDVADCIAFLPDYAFSEGAKTELQYCRYINKQVLMIQEEVVV